MSASKRILVVDDEPGLRLSIVANLELEGFAVLEAGSGLEALEVLGREPIDLVLADVRMPGMNGVDLFRRIRTLYPGIPVILMTAFALEGLVQSALREGVFTLLPKPFEIANLVAALSAAARLPLVLIVDDSAPVAETTAAALRSVGVVAESVTDGERALAMVRRGDVDVCVVDMVMPGMDGITVIERVHELDPRIVCIAVSGFDVQEMFIKVAAHVYRFFRKPVEPGELAEAIARARGRTR